MLGKKQGKAVLVYFSQSLRQLAVVRTGAYGKWQDGARRGLRYGKVLGKEKWQVARRGEERMKAW